MFLLLFFQQAAFSVNVRLRHDFLPSSTAFISCLSYLYWDTSPRLLSRCWIRTHPIALDLIFFPVGLFSRNFKPALDGDMTQCHPVSDCFLIRQCCLYFCFRQQVVHMSRWNATQCLSFSKSWLINQYLIWDMTFCPLLIRELLPAILFPSKYFTFSYTSEVWKNWIGTGVTSCFRLLPI